jgi:hypothetical protein
MKGLELRALLCVRRTGVRRGDGREKWEGIPHPECFVQRVWNRLKRLEITSCAAQKSA